MDEPADEQQIEGALLDLQTCSWRVQRCDFEQQKGSLLKQQYLGESPRLGTGRRDGAEDGEYMFNGDS